MQSNEMRIALRSKRWDPNELDHHASDLYYSSSSEKRLPQLLTDLDASKHMSPAGQSSKASEASSVESSPDTLMGSSIPAACRAHRQIRLPNCHKVGASEVDPKGRGVRQVQDLRG